MDLCARHAKHVLSIQKHGIHNFDTLSEGGGGGGGGGESGQSINHVIPCVIQPHIQVPKYLPLLCVLHPTCLPATFTVFCGLLTLIILNHLYNLCTPFGPEDGQVLYPEPRPALHSI